MDYQNIILGNKQEQNKEVLEKESNKYINEFLLNPDQQYFYIQSTDIFIKYDGKNLLGKFANEDGQEYNIIGFLQLPTKYVIKLNNHNCVLNINEFINMLEDNDDVQFVFSNHVTNEKLKN